MSRGAIAGRSCEFSAPSLMEDSGMLQSSEVMTKKPALHEVQHERWRNVGYPNHALGVDIFLKNCACEYAVVIGFDVLWSVWHLRKNHSTRGIFAKNAGEFNIVNIKINKNIQY